MNTSAAAMRATLCGKLSAPLIIEAIAGVCGSLVALQKPAVRNLETCIGANSHVARLTLREMKRNHFGRTTHRQPRSLKMLLRQGYTEAGLTNAASKRSPGIVETQIKCPAEIMRNGLGPHTQMTLIWERYPESQTT